MSVHQAACCDDLFPGLLSRSIPPPFPLHARVHCRCDPAFSNFLGIGADYACNASVQVDAAQAAGILISNGEFTSFHDKTFAPNSTARSAQIVTGPNNSGPVQISNTAFWGPTSNVARLLGHGTTTFSSCVFVQWDLQKKDGSAAIEVQGGSLVVQGTEFQMKGTQLLLSKAAKKVRVNARVQSGVSACCLDWGPVGTLACLTVAPDLCRWCFSATSSPVQRRSPTRARKTCKRASTPLTSLDVVKSEQFAYVECIILSLGPDAGSTPRIHRQVPRCAGFLQTTYFHRAWQCRS